MSDFHIFRTPKYSGVWLKFSGDRLQFRKQLQAHLQKTLSDPEGILSVNERGPQWIGKTKLSLSYSHTASIAIAVYSNTHLIGVDVEMRDRTLSGDPIEISKRFFHENETHAVSKLNGEALKEAFLGFWVKKEARGKLSRLGLKQSIHLETKSDERVQFEPVPVAPVNSIAYVAIALHSE